jgi:hypothetical protein
MSFPFHTHVLIRIHVGSTIESCLACDVDAPALEGERLGSFGDNPGTFCSFTNSSASSHLILLDDRGTTVEGVGEKRTHGREYKG